MKKQHNVTASLGMSGPHDSRMRVRKKALADGFIIAEKLTHTLVFRYKAC